MRTILEVRLKYVGFLCVYLYGIYLHIYETEVGDRGHKVVTFQVNTIMLKRNRSFSCAMAGFIASVDTRLCFILPFTCHYHLLPPCLSIYDKDHLHYSLLWLISFGPQCCIILGEVQ